MNTYTSFLGTSLIKRGSIEDVIRETKKINDSQQSERLVIYSDENCSVIDIDYRGTLEDVFSRLSNHPMLGQVESESKTKRGRGRPKLGVVSREVTLLPRHWNWLNSQRGGASAAIRELVDQARDNPDSEQNKRIIIDKIHKFLWDLASDLPGFEESSRLLFAGKMQEFQKSISHWPHDIVEHVKYLKENI